MHSPGFGQGVQEYHEFNIDKMYSSTCGAWSTLLSQLETSRSHTPKPLAPGRVVAYEVIDFALGNRVDDWYAFHDFHKLIFPLFLPRTWTACTGLKI